MWLRLNHPNELKRAPQDPDPLEKLPDEVLRLAGAIPMTLRVATEDITLGDHVVARGDLIGIGLLAANRDPAVFPDPDRLDLSRPDRTSTRLTPVTNAHLVCRLLLEKKKTMTSINDEQGVVINGQ